MFFLIPILKWKQSGMRNSSPHPSLWRFPVTATHSTARNHLFSSSLHYIDRQVNRSAISLGDYLFFFHLPKEFESTPLLRQLVSQMKWSEQRNNKGAIYLSDPERFIRKVWEGRHKCWWVIICLEGMSQQMSLPSFQAEANNPSKHHRMKKQNKEATLVCC